MPDPTPDDKPSLPPTPGAPSTTHPPATPNLATAATPPATGANLPMARPVESVVVTPKREPKPAERRRAPERSRPSDAEQIRIARDLGLDPRAYEDDASLARAVAMRRTMIANLDRDAMADVLRWAGRRVGPHASREQLAVEIALVKSMRFTGLSHRGLVVLARLRGLDVPSGAGTPDVVALLKSQEGLLAKLNRKRRSFVGKLLARAIGDDEPVPTAAPQPAGRDADEPGTSRPRADEPSRPLQHEIEESGLFAGITNRVKRSADGYINQKLDEIEARIDRKLDEIDRRLGEWRDKEIASRIRILKISLWATVIVAVVTLIISYARLYWGT